MTGPQPSEQSGTMTGQADQASENGLALSDQEQDCLVRAIQSALEVRQRDQFHAWIRGPFRALLPHDSLVCMELGGQGEIRGTEFLRCDLAEAAAMDLLCNPVRGLAVNLARALPGEGELCLAADAETIGAINAAAGPAADRRLPGNAVIHRTRLLSGAAYCFVLFDVPESRVHRLPALFRLLSSHLKMALSRALAGRGRPEPLTRRELEILGLMALGRSNREISGLLGISPVTLKHHVSKVYRKLNVQNRAEAVSRGISALSE